MDAERYVQITHSTECPTPYDGKIGKLVRLYRGYYQVRFDGEEKVKIFPLYRVVIVELGGVNV